MKLMNKCRLEDLQRIKLMNKWLQDLKRMKWMNKCLKDLRQDEINEEMIERSKTRWNEWMIDLKI